jgi:hypothetical protein
LKYGDELLYITGSPYDTLLEVIGVNGNGIESLKEHGVHYNEVKLNNGKIDNYRLPSRWFIVAAGNKLSDLGNMAGTEMSAEMQNRFFHLNLVPKLKDFESHAKSDKKMNPDILEFLSFDESKIHQMDTDPEILNVDPTFATPRSWTAASKEHYYVVGGDWSKKLSKSELIDIYRPHIGNTAYLFAEYIDMRDNYNVSDILDVYKNGAKAKRDLPRKLDQAWAAIVAITSYVYNKNLRNVAAVELSAKTNAHLVFVIFIACGNPTAVAIVVSIGRPTDIGAGPIKVSPLDQLSVP